MTEAISRAPQALQLNHHRSGTGRPLVLIHGIGSRWQMWMPVIPLLEPTREVIALDLPGFAGSPPPPPGTPPGPASLARLVAEFLAGLDLDRPGALPDVAGNSLGGWVALELARGGRARSVTGLSPAGFHNRREAAYQRAVLTGALRAGRLLAPYADTVLAARPLRRLAFAPFVARPATMAPREAAESLRALADAPWFEATLSAALAGRFEGGEQITAAVTIAWGERDRLLVRRQLLRALREIPNARGAVLRGCGHIPTYDDPAAVARVLLAAAG